MKILEVIETNSSDTSVLASYNLFIEIAGIEGIYWSEVRKSPYGLHIDWSDELSEELNKVGLNNDKVCSSINCFIHDFYLGNKVELLTIS